MFSEVDSNGVTRIVTPMPKPMPLACTNSHVRKKVKKTCNNIFPVLKEHNAVRNISSYSLSQLEPLPIFQSADMVYCILTDEGLRAEQGQQTMTSNQSNLIQKIGYTGALQYRKYDAETTKRIRVILNSGMISPQLDKILVDDINVLVSELRNDPQTPHDLKRLLEIYQSGGDDLGMRRALYFQCNEIACQLHFGKSSPMEAFAYDEEWMHTQRQIVDDVMDILVPLIHKGKKKSQSGMCSWATGKAADRLSSQLVFTEYVLQNGEEAVEWDGAMPNPVYENARTAEELFSTDFDETEMREGMARIIAKIDLNTGNVILDTNKILFSDKKLAGEFKERKYTLVADIFDGGIRIWEKNGCIYFVHTPLGFGTDSREVTNGLLSQQIRTFLQIEILRQCIVIISKDKEEWLQKIFQGMPLLKVRSFSEKTADKLFALESKLLEKSQGKGRVTILLLADERSPLSVGICNWEYCW